MILEPWVLWRSELGSKGRGKFEGPVRGWSEKLIGAKTTKNENNRNVGNFLPSVACRFVW